MSTDNTKTNIEAREPLLNSTNKNKQIVSSENTTKSDDVRNKQQQAKEKSRQRTKSVAIIEEEDEKEMEKWQYVPPDGGWGWLVLFGSTLVNVLVPGMLKSFGVLFVEFQEAFHASPTTASWIPALAYFLYSSLGPVSSLLSVRYSYRSVTMAGGTFAALGMIFSFFAGSIHYLYVSYGVMVGIGAGLSFPPTVYIVTSYFMKLRGLANGICISGSALGSIILPPVVRVLLEAYGYRGAVLLMGGVTLNVWVAALFYDPVTKHMKKVLKKTPETAETKEEPQPKFLLNVDDSTGSLQQIPRNDSFLETLDLSSNAFNRSVSSAAVQNLKSQNRERKISMPISRNEIVKARCSTGSSRSNMNSSSALHAVPEDNRNTAMDLFSQNRLPTNRRVPRRSPSTSSFMFVSTPFHGSTLTLQPEAFASSFSLKSTSKKEGATLEEEKKNRFFDISVLKDPVYLIILISNATNAISYTNFIILLPTYATSLEFDKNMAALLLSIVSALDLVGRIGGSALSDLPLCPKEWYFITGLFVSGVSLSIMPFFSSYAVICVFCAFFGLASGVYVGITAVIMTDMLGEEKLQSTYGISLFVNGILQLIGPPLCGVYIQTTASYTSLFCMLGIFLIVGTSIWGLMPFVKKRNKKEDEVEGSTSP